MFLSWVFYSATHTKSQERPSSTSPSLWMWEKQFPGEWRRTIKVRLSKSSTSSQAFCSLIGIWGGWGHQGSSVSLWMTETLTGLFRAWPEQMSFRQNVINSMRSQPRASLSGYLSHTHIYTSAAWRVFRVGARAGKHQRTRTHMLSSHFPIASVKLKQSVVSSNLHRDICVEWRVNLLLMGVEWYGHSEVETP